MKKSRRIISSVTISDIVSIDPNIERGVSYTGILDLNGLKKKLQGNYSLAMAAEFPAYKWFPDSRQVYQHALYYEPPDNIPARKAATLDKGLGNLLISHLPGWAGLPDRETAAMVYSARKTAYAFSKKSSSDEDGNYPGWMYRAVPALNARLVIAPAAHLRFCFQYALDQWGITNAEYGPLGRLHGCFSDLFRACGMEAGFPFDWPLFLMTLNDIAFEKIRPQRALYEYTQVMYGILIDHKADLSEFLDNAFSPSNNGFKFVDYSEGLKKEEYPDSEIWTASPCLLIEEELFERMGVS